MERESRKQKTRIIEGYQKSTGNMSQILHEIATYTPYDALTIATLIILEGLLSVDNALVLAALVRQLPRNRQRHALTLGVWGAIIFRIIAVILAAQLIQIREIKLIGGLYLIYLAFKNMFPHYSNISKENNSKKPLTASFWKVVLLVELTDIVFSIDSITTAVAMTPKVSVIILGGIVGILAMRFVAMVFIKLLEKYPGLDDIAYQIIFFIGVKLSLECFHFEMDEKMFWMVIAFIVLIGISVIYKSGRKVEKTTSVLITANSEEFIEGIKTGRIEVEDLFAEDNQFSSDFLRYLIQHDFLELTRKARIRKIKRVSSELYSDSPPERPSHDRIPEKKQ
ncbi:MAG: TerC family protein [Candidatus Eremiobacteraeota bacterium]|nr:TerC family protein [Candidatus Eremiobacteraeota bacterium]